MSVGSPEQLRGLRRAGRVVAETLGRPGIVLERDGWTVCTADRAPSAHQEHTIMVSASGGPLVLTAA